MNPSHRNHRPRRTTRKQFLVDVAALSYAVPAALAAPVSVGGPKVLLVVAHPDDEYAFAATVYRVARELNGTVDQIVITNGEAGFRYSKLAERYYGLQLTSETVGRSRLPGIRKQEAERAGRILGIRHHWFLEQRDARFTLDGREVLTGIWDTEQVIARIETKLRSERYDFVFVMLPTPETHGHHQAAALLALDAVERLPAAERPTVLGAEASAIDPPAPDGHSGAAGVQVPAGPPAWRVSRVETLPDQPALTYSIVVNWVISEHKSQGLFQTETGRHTHENFWLFQTGTPGAGAKAQTLFASLTTQVRSRR